MKAASACAVIICTVLLICLPVDAFSAGQISISAAVSRGAIPFEGTDTLTVALVWQGEPFQYMIDSFPMPAIEKMKVLGSSSAVSTSPSSGGGEETHRVFTYVLSPVDYGVGVVAPLNLTAKNRVTGEMTELKTGRITVEIAKPLPPAKKKTVNLIIILGAIAVVIVMAAIAGFLIMRGKRQTAALSPAPQLQYIDALDAIKKETISDRKLFYSRLYRLLLQYVERERGLAVTGKTGEEVIGIVSAMEPEDERKLFAVWLHKALEEKYLPDMPSSGEVENSYNSIRQFFENKAKLK